MRQKVLIGLHITANPFNFQSVSGYTILGTWFMYLSSVGHGSDEAKPSQLRLVTGLHSSKLDPSNMQILYLTEKSILCDVDGFVTRSYCFLQHLSILN